MHHKTEEATPANKTISLKLNRHKVYTQAKSPNLVRLNERQGLKGRINKIFRPAGEAEIEYPAEFVTLTNEYLTTNLAFGSLYRTNYVALTTQAIGLVVKG